MENIKIIFFDIDGTLIAMNHDKISKKVLQTLKQLQQKGIKLCIATGRGPMMIPRFDNVEFDLFLAYNGSYCYTKEEILYSHAISTRDIDTVINNADKMKKIVALATKDSIVANGVDPNLIEYCSFGKAEIKIEKDFEEAKKEGVYQILMGIRENEYEEAIENVSSVKISAWWDRAVDIIPSDAGKGIGIERVLKYYGFDKTQSMAFGDGNNDIEMLQAVGIGIAMDNASDELKAVADEICEDVVEDGIYQFCLKKHLIENISNL